MLPLPKERSINWSHSTPLWKARTLWVLLFSLFGVQWVLPATVKEMFLRWNGTFVGKKRKGVWKASPLCLFWTLWKTRNKVAFEEIELSIQRLKSSFVYLLWSETDVYKRWSLDLSWFCWLGGLPLRVVFGLLLRPWRSARVWGAFFHFCNSSHCFGGFLIQSLYWSKKKKVPREEKKNV